MDEMTVHGNSLPSKNSPATARVAISPDVPDGTLIGMHMGIGIITGSCDYAANTSTDLFDYLKGQSSKEIDSKDLDPAVISQLEYLMESRSAYATQLAFSSVLSTTGDLVECVSRDYKVRLSGELNARVFSTPEAIFISQRFNLVGGSATDRQVSIEKAQDRFKDKFLIQILDADTKTIDVSMRVDRAHFNALVAVQRAIDASVAVVRKFLDTMDDDVVIREDNKGVAIACATARGFLASKSGACTEAAFNALFLAPPEIIAEALNPLVDLDQLVPVGKDFRAATAANLEPFTGLGAELLYEVILPLQSLACELVQRRSYVLSPEIMIRYLHARFDAEKPNYCSYNPTYAQRAHAATAALGALAKADPRTLELLCSRVTDSSIPIWVRIALVQSIGLSERPDLYARETIQRIFNESPKNFRLVSQDPIESKAEDLSPLDKKELAKRATTREYVRDAYAQELKSEAIVAAARLGVAVHKEAFNLVSAKIHEYGKDDGALRGIKALAALDAYDELLALVRMIQPYDTNFNAAACVEAIGPYASTKPEVAKTLFLHVFAPADEVAFDALPDPIPWMHDAARVAAARNNDTEYYFPRVYDPGVYGNSVRSAAIMALANAGFDYFQQLGLTFSSGLFNSQSYVHAGECARLILKRRSENKDSRIIASAELTCGYDYDTPSTPEQFAQSLVNLLVRGEYWSLLRVNSEDREVIADLIPELPEQLKTELIAQTLRPRGVMEQDKLDSFKQRLLRSVFRARANEFREATVAP